MKIKKINMKNIKKFFNNRQFKYGTNALIITVAVIGIFLLGNMLISKLNLPKMDLTKDKKYSLSDYSKKIVKNINKDVNVYFFDSTSTPTSSDERGEIEDLKILIKQYASTSGHIKYKEIDPEKDPTMGKKYGIQELGALVFECNSKVKKVEKSELYSQGYEYGEFYYMAEQQLTSSLMFVTSDKVQNIYFIEGHEEYSTENQLAALNKSLQTEAYTTKTLNLLTTPQIPADADVIVIASPKRDYTQIEVDAIKKYLNNGGKAVMLFGFDQTKTSLPNIESLTASLGVTVDKDIVGESQAQNVAFNNAFYIVPQINQHESTSQLIASKLQVLVPQSRSLTIVDDTQKQKLGVEIIPILRTTDTSFKITDFSKEPDPKTAQKGSSVIAAAITKKTYNNKEMKVWISGNIQFLTSEPLPNYLTALNTAGNKDLILNTLSWLTSRPALNEIRPIYKATERLIMNPQQIKACIVIVYIIPFLILIAGIVVTIRRKRT